MSVVSTVKNDAMSVTKKPILFFVFGVLFAVFLWPFVRSGFQTLQSKGVPVPAKFLV